jgi:hypothetical protein
VAPSTQSRIHNYVNLHCQDVLPHPKPLHWPMYNIVCSMNPNFVRSPSNCGPMIKSYIPKYLKLNNNVDFQVFCEISHKLIIRPFKQSFYKNCSMTSV